MLRTHVKIKFSGILSELTDRDEYSFEVSRKMTIRDALLIISASSKKGFCSGIYDAATGKMNEHISVFINSKDMRSFKGLDTVLNPGDEIVIAPAVD